MPKASLICEKKAEKIEKFLKLLKKTYRKAKAENKKWLRIESEKNSLA